MFLHFLYRLSCQKYHCFHWFPMYLMLQQPAGDDFVIATGSMHTVREFADLAFGFAGLDYRDYVDTDPSYLRPTEVDALRGDASKAHRLLGWRPRITFEDLVREMVDHEMDIARREKARS